MPELLTVVHAVLEEPSPPRFILTGSSARKLRRGGLDLLGGRAVQRTLHPFMAADCRISTSFGRCRSGFMLPLVVGAFPTTDVLVGYASLYSSSGQGFEEGLGDGDLPLHRAGLSLALGLVAHEPSDGPSPAGDDDLLARFDLRQ